MADEPVILLDAPLLPDPDAEHELGVKGAQALADEQTQDSRLVIIQRAIEPAQVDDLLGGVVHLLCTFQPAPGARFTSARLALKLLTPEGIKIADLTPRSAHPPASSCIIRGSGEATALALWMFSENPQQPTGLGHEQPLSLTIPSTGLIDGQLSVSARLVRPGLPGALDTIRDLILRPDAQRHDYPVCFDIPNMAPATPHRQGASMPGSPRNRVFISYSHQDTPWLRRLQTHLQPFVRAGVIEPWDDTQIKPGDDWRAEIQNALDHAQVAVLLISADFLASKFIADHELPPLLAKAASEGTVVLPLIVGHSVFEDMPEFARFQAINPPSQPLAGLSPPKQEAVLVQAARVIRDALG